MPQLRPSDRNEDNAPEPPVLSPRVLVTGFGPFPNAPENPTALLAETLGSKPPEAFGATAVRGMVLPTEYRRSWALLRRVYSSFEPDIVVHFGLSRTSDRLKVERLAFRSVDPSRADAVGFAPRSGFAWRTGPDSLPSSLPVGTIVSALLAAGFPAAASEDPGRYVCNATLYRSLTAAGQADRRVGFVHVPPEGVNGFTDDRLQAAAQIVLREAVIAAHAPSPETLT